MNNQENIEFQEQLKKSIEKALIKLKTDLKLINLKKCYYDNFDIIKSLIDKNGAKISIEDINETCNLTYNKIDSFLMQEINYGIEKK